MILDDANSYFNTHIWTSREGKKVYEALSGTLATIRTVISNLIITAVSVQELAKPIRYMVFHRAYTTLYKDAITLHVYRLHYLPNGVSYIKKWLTFTIVDKIPQDVYENYAKLRDEMATEAIRLFKEAVETAKEEEMYNKLIKRLSMKLFGKELKKRLKKKQLNEEED